MAPLVPDAIRRPAFQRTIFGKMFSSEFLKTWRFSFFIDLAQKKLKRASLLFYEKSDTTKKVFANFFAVSETFFCRTEEKNSFGATPMSFILIISSTVGVGARTGLGPTP